MTYCLPYDEGEITMLAWSVILQAIDPTNKLPNLSRGQGTRQLDARNAGFHKIPRTHNRGLGERRDEFGI